MQAVAVPIEHEGMVALAATALMVEMPVESGLRHNLGAAVGGTY
jgi:hypothetical protein